MRPPATSAGRYQEHNPTRRLRPPVTVSAVSLQIALVVHHELAIGRSLLVAQKLHRHKIWDVRA